jgi:hypothetical protein
MNPITTPASVPADTASPKPARSTTTHSGIEAIMSAANPDGTLCSATATMPFPPRSSVIPTSAQPPSWGRVIRMRSRPPVTRSHPYISPPATRNRVPIPTSGGMVSTVTRIARYVEPQIR